MTKKFEKAKAKTIQKCSKVLRAIRVAKYEEMGMCGFCLAHDRCNDCPITKLCGGKLHNEVKEMLAELEAKVIEGISLLEKVEEKSNV